MKSFSIIFALLAVSAVVIFGCKKNKTAAIPRNYTHNMAGMHVWAGTVYEYTSGFMSSPDTVEHFSSDSSSITVINDTAIVYQHDTLKYFYTNYKDTVAFAWGVYYDSTDYVRDTLLYNYSLNEIGHRRYTVSPYNAYMFTYIDEHTP